MGVCGEQTGFTTGRFGHFHHCLGAVDSVVRPQGGSDLIEPRSAARVLLPISATRAKYIPARRYPIARLPVFAGGFIHGVGPGSNASRTRFTGTLNHRLSMKGL